MTDKNNTGKENSGHYNSGHYNSGNYNSGHYNSGHYNSGHSNSGHYNSGHYNSGTSNSGHSNSGHYNSGHYNSGNYNSGTSNSGHYNSGNYNSGDFNTDEPNVRLFNKDTGKKRSEITVPYISLPVTEWVAESDMTVEEKKANPKFFVASGFLRTLSYKDAWAKAWNITTQEVRNQFLAIPNFDADIFFEITGVDVRVKTPKKETCDGKVVEIDGKKYKLTEVQ